MTSQPSAAPAGSTPLPPKSNATKTPAGQGKGNTTIAESVVAKIAGIAARQVPGVYALGGGVARAMGQIRDVVSQHDMAQGVTVEVGHTQAAVDVILVVDYPYPLQDVAGHAWIARPSDDARHNLARMVRWGANPQLCMEDAFLAALLLAEGA